MRTKTILFFWFSGFAIALVSITIALRSFQSVSSISIISKSAQSGFNLAIFDAVFKQSGESLLSILRTIFSRHHHHRRRQKCDMKNWKSRLIIEYNVSLVLTVGLKGCTNFSSVQKAVDAAPELSTNRTLIIIDSGTYR